MWVVGSNIAIIIRNVRTGHVVSGMLLDANTHIWMVGFSIVIGMDILDMRSVLCSTCGWLCLVC